MQSRINPHTGNEAVMFRQGRLWVVRLINPRGEVILERKFNKQSNAESLFRKLSTAPPPA